MKFFKSDIVKKYKPNVIKKTVVDSISFSLPEMKSEIGCSLYKLYYGNKYIIHKGKTLAGSLFLIQKGYAYFFGYNHQTKDNRNHYYFKFYNYIRKHPGLEYRVELLLQTEDALEILKSEQLELWKTFKDKKCLNNNITSYIPVYREKTDSYGWISKEQVELFNLWVSNYF